MFRNIFLGFEATKLTPGSVTLDDLTIDSLKQKMQEIEMKLQGKTSIMIIFQFFNCIKCKEVFAFYLYRLLYCDFRMSLKNQRKTDVYHSI